MRILITNDDGYDAPGLLALYNAVKDFGDVFVGPPSECHSSKGHAVCTKSAIAVTKHLVDGIGEVQAIHSSPADCVRIAIQQLMPEPPDLVIAGINPGANMGVDVYYSGTVAAAREAAIMGIPAIAVSTYVRQDVELSWHDKSELTAKYVQRLTDVRTEPGEFWNLNFPAVEPGQSPKDLRFTDQSTESQGVSFEPHPDQPDSYRFTGDYSKRPARQNADVRAVFDGFVSASLLRLDTTSTKDVESLSN